MYVVRGARLLSEDSSPQEASTYCSRRQLRMCGFFTYLRRALDAWRPRPVTVVLIILVLSMNEDNMYMEKGKSRIWRGGEVYRVCEEHACLNS